MPDYIVKSAVKKKDLEARGNYAAKTLYLVELDGQPKAVELSLKAGSAAPAPGDKLTGTIEESQYGPKFKKEYGGNGGGGGGGGYRGRSPEDHRSIVRQHSQQMALMWFTARGAKTFSDDELKERIDWFVADAEGAVPKPQPVSDASWAALKGLTGSFPSMAEFNTYAREQLGHELHKDSLTEDEALPLIEALRARKATEDKDYDPFAEE